MHLRPRGHKLSGALLGVLASLVGSSVGARPADAAAALVSNCSGTVTGAAKTSFSGVAGFGTELWLDNAALEQMVAVIKMPDGKARIATGKPLAAVFTLNCGSPGATVSIGAAAQSVYADFPLEPKTYRFGAAKGNVSMIATIGKDAYLSKGGTMRVTAFNRKHFAGTFTIDAVTFDKKKSAKIVGSFDTPCVAQPRCAK